MIMRVMGRIVELFTGELREVADLKRQLTS